MSLLFQEASDLNNKGVAALLKGDQIAAIRLFEHSIKVMRSELSNAASVSNLGNSQSSRSTSSRSMHNTHTVEIPYMETSDSIVFNQAIQLPADDPFANYHDKSIYTSAVVFNYALLLHFKASAGDEASMGKAEKVYGMALKLLACNDSCGSVHLAIVINLACINNLSQIRYCKGDIKNGQEGIQQVSLLIQKSSDQTLFQEPKVQGLLMNAFLLMPPLVARAA